MAHHLQTPGHEGLYNLLISEFNWKKRVRCKFHWIYFRGNLILITPICTEFLA